MTRARRTAGDIVVPRAGKSKAQLKATGTNLQLPAPVSATKLFEQSSTVTVQLVKQGGPGADVCWTSEFDVAHTKSNSPEKFKAAAK
jgi:hypothetical protein